MQIPYIQSQSMAADRTTTASQPSRPPRTAANTTIAKGGLTTYLRQLHSQFPNSTQLVGILTLIISGGSILLCTGTAIVLSFIFFAPIIILSSPFWLPFALLFVAPVIGFICFCVGAFAASSWLYRYFKGLHPPGSDQFDYARSRIADRAREVKDYAKEYGGFLHCKVKDTAPGA